MKQRLLKKTLQANSPFASGSMEPAFYRGDLLFLTNPARERYRIGDIAVYRVDSSEIPIVHRVLQTHDVPMRGNGSVFLLFPSFSFSYLIVPFFSNALALLLADRKRS